MILLLAVLLQQPPNPPVGFPGHAGDPGGIEANKLYFQGKYSEALALYREGETSKDRGGFCGTCRMQRAAKYRLAKAVCLEQLGRVDEAASAYLRIGGGWVYARLADLYDAAGQRDDFKALADQLDERTLKSFKGDRTMLKYSPAVELRRVLEIRDLEKSEKWQELVNCLQVDTAPREAANRSADWSAMEAARILARHPAEATPLLLKQFEAGESGANGWIPYALGLCGRPEGIAALQARTRTEGNIHVSLSLVFSLSQGGEPGKSALATLRESAKGNLKLALDEWSCGKLGQSELDVKFPPAFKSVKLPTRLDP